MNDWKYGADLMVAAFQRQRFWPHEREWQVIEYSLMERLNWVLRDESRRVRFLEELMDGATTYQVETVSDIFQAILTVDISLAELLDRHDIPRKWEGNKFRPIYGPAPEFWGPPPPDPIQPVLRRVVPGLINVNEIQVQPLFRHVENLPLTSGFPDYMGTLKSLVEVQPLKLDEKRFTLKPGSPESFKKVGEMAKNAFRRLGFPVDE